MAKWNVTIESWPHSTGNGADKDQQAAGERTRVIVVDAEDIEGALKAAKIFVEGMKTNPMVWQAPIMSITKARP